MLDVKFIRENAKLVEKSAKDKGVDIDIDKVLKLDKQRVELQAKLDKLRAEKNKASKEIGAGGDKKEIVKKMQAVDKETEQLELKLKKIEPELSELLLSIPNPAKPDVKVGESEADNEVLRKWGEPAKFDFKPQDHLALGEALNLIDTKRAAKVSGARFAFLKNQAVLLQQALIKFAFDKLQEHGFQLVVPPALIRDESMRAMGYLEHGGEQETYRFDKDNLYLIGTSEQVLGPMHMNEILAESELPLRYVAYSPCFRREAGTYGKDTKGILRLHQFDKVEMFVFTTPEQSDEEHENLLKIEEDLMQALEIPYQVVKMVTADLGNPAARKYDIEAWVPSQNKYRETHSCSTTTDFQARRLNTRYKTKDGKTEYVHTLNGTAFAMGRTLIAIMENYQQADGSIKVPKALVPYTGFTEIKATK